MSNWQARKGQSSERANGSGTVRWGHEGKRSAVVSRALLGFTIACFVVASGCTTPGIRKAVQDKQAPADGPKVLAVYMPWFGNHTHIDVGYSSEDPGVLRKQIEEARHRGISGFVVDWYGKDQPYSDHNFGLLEQIASETNFHVALLYNEAEDESDDATDDAMSAFKEAYQSYIGPQAPYRNAYLTYNGHPMIFIFPKRGHVNWNRIQQMCSDWEATPFLIYKDEPPAQYNSDFAGSYAWVQPGKGGWAPDGSNWGESYLQYFYKTMKSKYPDKIVVGGAWPGFNDSSAAWSLNRHMQSRCGKTFDDTLNFYHHFYDSSDPIPFMLIETWNDYEEGTAIEHRTMTNCNNRASAPKGTPQRG